MTKDPSGHPQDKLTFRITVSSWLPLAHDSQRHFDACVLDNLTIPCLAAPCRRRCGVIVEALPALRQTLLFQVD